MIKEGVLFNEEYDIARFLGVCINGLIPDHIVQTQVSLIKKSMSVLNVDYLPIFHTPTTEYLGIGKDREFPQGMEQCDYVVGQLKYLTLHSKFNLGMTTSQAAQYFYYPYCFNELTLKIIGCYL